MNIREFDNFIFASNLDGQWAALPHDQKRMTQAETMSSQRSAALLAENLVIPDETSRTKFDAAKARWHGHENGEPRLFIVHLTQRCNLTCGFCHSSAVSVAAKGMDATPETLTTVARFIALSPGRSKTIAFQGGEPSLCLDLIALFQAALTEFMPPGTEVSYGMTTNGTLLSEAVLDRLDAMGVKLSLSVDGPAPLHDVERRFEHGGGSYGVTATARQLLKSRYKRIYAGQIMVVTAQTAPHFREIIDEFVAAGGRSFRFKMVTPLGRGKRFVRDEGAQSANAVAATHIAVIEYLKQ
ncbi:MAG: radical SAM protein, partial [Paracoccaceae bacterium]